MTQPTPDATPPGGAPPEPAPDDAPRAPEERPIPIGCHPFVFGIVAATLQFGVTLYLMRSC